MKKKNTIKKSNKVDVSPRLLIIILVCIAIIGAIVVVTVLKIRKNNYNKIQDILTVGNNHLVVMEYDEALAEYLKIIDIDEQYTVAYIGIANVYKGKANECRATDIDAAINYLNTAIEWILKGYELTGSDSLESKKREIDALLASAIASKEAIVEGSIEYYEYNFQTEYALTYDNVSSLELLSQDFSSTGYNLLSDADRISLYSEYIDLLSSYIADLQYLTSITSSDSFWNNLYTNREEYSMNNEYATYVTGVGAYIALKNVYIIVGEYDQAVTLHEAYSTLAGESLTNAQTYIAASPTGDGTSEYNEYGQLIKMQNNIEVNGSVGEFVTSYVYDDSHRVSCIEHTSPESMNSEGEWINYSSKVTEVTYDKSGRVETISTTSTDTATGKSTTIISTYTYSNNNTVEIVYSSENNDNFTGYKEILEYNTYGIVTNCTTVLL